MSDFTGLEHRFARLLYGYPQVKQLAKWSYQVANYVLTGAWARPAVSLRDGVRVLDVCENYAAKFVPAGAESFFGYFDTSPWDSTGRKYLVGYIDQSVYRILVIDLMSEEVCSVGESPIWNYQQGTLAQWRNDETIIANTLVDDAPGISIWDTHGCQHMTIPVPAQEVHPEGDHYLSVNWYAIQRWRPDYGFPQLDQKVAGTPGDVYLDEVGISEFAKTRLVDIEMIRAVGGDDVSSDALSIELNHPKYSPCASKIAFLVRSYEMAGPKAALFIYSRSAGSLIAPMKGAVVSHYCWLSDDTLICWAYWADGPRGYFLITGLSKVECEVKAMGPNNVNDGHPTWSKARELVATDTYPGRDREQKIMIFDPLTIGADDMDLVAGFKAPLVREMSNRCDLHPRWSPDGKFLSIDSLHSGVRRNYMLDVSMISSKLA